MSIPNSFEAQQATSCFVAATYWAKCGHVSQSRVCHNANRVWVSNTFDHHHDRCDESCQLTQKPSLIINHIKCTSCGQYPHSPSQYRRPEQFEKEYTREELKVSLKYWTNRRQEELDTERAQEELRYQAGKDELIRRTRRVHWRQQQRVQQRQISWYARVILNEEDEIITNKLIHQRRLYFEVNDSILLNPHIIGSEGSDPSGSSSACPICMAEFTGGISEDVRKLLVCGHVYHYDCIRSWFRSAPELPSCPMCRQDYNIVELPSFDDPENYMEQPESYQDVVDWYSVHPLETVGRPEGI